MPKVTWNKSAAQLEQERYAKRMDILIHKGMAELRIRAVKDLGEKAGINPTTLRTKLNPAHESYGKFTGLDLTKLAMALNWSEKECAVALGRAR